MATLSVTRSGWHEHIASGYTAARGYSISVVLYTTRAQVVVMTRPTADTGDVLCAASADPGTPLYSLACAVCMRMPDDRMPVEVFLDRLWDLLSDDWPELAHVLRAYPIVSDSVPF